MKTFSSVFSCFHADILNKYIFFCSTENFRKFSGKFSVRYFSGKATSLCMLHTVCILCMHACVYVGVSAHNLIYHSSLRVCVCMYICMYVYMYVCIYVCMLHICTYVCMYVCVYRKRYYNRLC